MKGKIMEERVNPEGDDQAEGSVGPEEEEREGSFEESLENAREAHERRSEDNEEDEDNEEGGA